MVDKVMFSSGKDDYETPDELFHNYDHNFHFILDAAANESNHKCDQWFGPGGVHSDALEVNWIPYLRQGNIWLNPPYSRKLQRAFLVKVFQEIARPGDHATDGYGKVVCLLPARTDTYNFHSLIKPFSQSIEFLKGRVKFKGSSHGSPFPSMVVIF